MDNLENGVPKDFHHIWNSYISFEYLFRSKDENIGDFLTQWKEQMRCAQSAGCEYSDVLLACKLLDKSNLETSEVEEIVNSVCDSKDNEIFSRVFSRLEELTHNDSELEEDRPDSFYLSKLEKDPLAEIKDEPPDKPSFILPEVELSGSNNLADISAEELETKEVFFFKCLNCNADLEVSNGKELGKPNSGRFYCKSCDKKIHSEKKSKRKMKKAKRNALVGLRNRNVSKIRCEPEVEDFIKDVEQKDHSCDICGKSFVREGNLNLHLNKHHGFKEAKKSQGKFKAVEKSLHAKGKEGYRKNHPCSICGKRFQRPNLVELHFYRHHVPTILQECAKCKRTFCMLSRLKKHEFLCGKERIKKVKNNQSSKKPTCDICGRVFRKQYLLNVHFNKQHVPSVLQECNKCGERFEMAASLERHEPRCGKGIRSTTCDICGKSFKKHYGLLLHMVHHTKEKSFKCEFCPATYGYESSLISHRKKHVENKSLCCPKCPKIYTCNFDLKVHLRQCHPLIHKFQCGQCTYTTDMKCRYERHLLSHTSIKRYKCKLCDKPYRDLKNVKHHVPSQHKMELGENYNLTEFIVKLSNVDD